MSETINDFLNMSNKNIKETITRLEQKQIELEAEYNKNEIILKELRKLLVKNKISF